MKTNDDKTLNKAIEKQAAAEIAKKFNVKVIPYGEITIIEGEDDDVEKAANEIINNVNARKTNKITIKKTGKPTKLEPGLLLTDYSESEKYFHTYKLIEFDKSKNKWRCSSITYKQTLYLNSNADRYFHIVRRQTIDIAPEDLKKLDTFTM